MKSLGYRSLFGMILIIIGFSGFFGLMLCTILGGYIPSWMEVPMGDMGSIAVDRAGNIYCASTRYGRLQIYNNEGKFIRGMFLTSEGNMMTLYFDSTERLNIYIHRYHTLCIFNPDGTIAEKRRCELGVTIDPCINRPARDLDGNIYSIVTPSFYPRVRKTTPEGKERIIVAVPWYLLIVQAPFPSGIIVFIGMVIAGGPEAMKKSKEAAVRPLGSRRGCLYLFGVILLIIGFSGFMGSAIICIFLRSSITSQMELPMGEMGSIAMDRAGNIYCASSSYERIQVYNKEGKFVRGMFVSGGARSIAMDRTGTIFCQSNSCGRIRVYDNEGKFVREMFVGDDGGDTITMYFDSMERLHVYLPRSHTLGIFNPDGTLAEQRKCEVGETIDRSINRHIRDLDGTIYSIVTPSFYPRVRKTTPEGKERIIVAVPWYLLIVQIPLPSWIIAVIGMVIAVGPEALKKRKEAVKRP